MKSKLLPGLLACLATLSFFPAAAWAKDAAAAKKPALRVDPSPVSEGKSALVTSYADIVEPVQKAVVSVYSKKIVR